MRTFIKLTLPKLQTAIQENTRKKLVTTKKMVEDAFITLHTSKGITLKQIYDYILFNYNLESLSRIRISLIKKHILSLKESNDIVNKTGRGLVGHFKLIDTHKFMQKLNKNNKSANETRNVTRKSKSTVLKQLENAKNKKDRIKSKPKNVKAKNKKKIVQEIHTEMRLPPSVNDTFTFDTPLVPSQVYASTPLIDTTFVPQAPRVDKRQRKKPLVEDDMETPRSSGKKKK